LPQSNITTAIVTGLTIWIHSFAAQAECRKFPDVSWWGNLSHASVSQYVANRHDGEWPSYNLKWQQQLNKLKIIHSKGKGIRTPDGNHLQGPGLAAYIEQVSKRVSINYCLTKEKTISDGSGPQVAQVRPSDGPSGPGDSAAGKAEAQKRGCFKCHGVNGRATLAEAPNLGGQKASYLIRQLNAFESAGEGMLPVDGGDYRYHAFMSEMALTLSPTNIKDIAAYFSGL